MKLTLQTSPKCCLYPSFELSCTGFPFFFKFLDESLLLICRSLNWKSFKLLCALLRFLLSFVHFVLLKLYLMLRSMEFNGIEINSASPLHSYLSFIHFSHGSVKLFVLSSHQHINQIFIPFRSLAVNSCSERNEIRCCW